MDSKDSKNEAASLEFKKKLEELKICYQRMHHVDDYTFKLSTIFYAINSALLVAMVGIIALPVPLILKLAIAYLAYFSSVASVLIEGKFQLFAWFVFLERAREIETELDYEINKKYSERLSNSSWRFIAQGRITYAFKFTIVGLWVFLILYIAWFELFWNPYLMALVVGFLFLPWILLTLASIKYGVKDK